MKLYLTFLKEIIALTGVVMAALSSVMFLFRILNFVEYIFISQDGLVSFFMFVVFLFPSIFKFTVPISLLISTTVVTLRMSHDRELEAWMAAGVGVLRFCVAPFFCGTIVTLLTLWSALYLEPLSRREFRKFKWMHARRSVEALIENKLKEKTFLSELFRTGESSISFYVDKTDDSRHEFKGVFLSISENKNAFSTVVVAESGSLRKEMRNGYSDYVFTLRNGTTYSPRIEQGKPPQWSTLHFAESRMSLVNLFSKQFDPGSFDSNDIRSLYPSEYLKELKKIREGDVNWRQNQRMVRDHGFFYEQVAVPFSCLFLPIIGVCLGMQDPRRKSSTAYLGLGICLLFYYASVMLCQQLALRNFAPPEITLWLPPLIMLILTLLMLRWRATNPPSTGFIEFLRRKS